MIRFACLSCGTKYELKSEFAGNEFRCRVCRQPLTVPSTGSVPLAVPVHIDGPASCLQQAGYSHGVILPQSYATRDPDDGPPPTVVTPGLSIFDAVQQAAASGQRYQVAGEVGRGGMGQVLRAIDCDIRREVAIKCLLDPDDPRKQARFVEEAQITGQLEHPNIAPVHELGVDAQGRLFFTMKLVRGRSLAQVLDRLRAEDQAAEKEFSLGRLLKILVNICHALAYAHSRGVVHRDLKPANVMLGDFGEVYVMDWGLAKVCGDAHATPAESANALTARVMTSRVEEQAELTQEGAVLGTPVYMPPEQAEGRVRDIDQRSDIYALGAILYEMLTLYPPVSTDGGYPAILQRVIQGDIMSPERLRPWRVPHELAAVTMKALARDPADRYSTADALRHDIERFQEGHSVSAKEDSPWEQVVKLIRRNRAVSGVTAAAVLVIGLILAFSFVTNYKARLRAEEAFSALVHEQETRRQQNHASAPLFLRDARASTARGELEHALSQVNIALDYDPELTEALLLKGQLFIGLKQFEQARKILLRYLERKPDDAAARKLAQLSRHARPNDFPLLRELHDVFLQQNEYALALRMLRRKEELLGEYRQRLVAAWGAEWPEIGNQLSLDRDGHFQLHLGMDYVLEKYKVIKTLEPLRGMMLTSLNLSHCPVTSLSPLEGMQLTQLSIGGCPVENLEALRGMPLTTLAVSGHSIRTLEPLRGMRLTNLNLAGCTNLINLAPLAGMPLEQLNLAKCPGINNIDALRGMRLTKLNLHQARFTEFSPLEKMPLTELDISSCGGLTDLKILKGMSLKILNLSSSNRVADLGPLSGMPLEILYLHGCERIHDLTPLDRMPLREIDLPLQVKFGLDVLRKMPSLQTINRKPAAEFWRAHDARTPNK